MRKCLLTMLRLRQEIAENPPLLMGAEWKIITRGLGLSPRESQIVRHVLVDEKEKAVAFKLGISAHTVHAHLKRVYWKLGVSSRVELVVRVFREYVAYARQNGLPRETPQELVVRRAA